MKKLVYGVGINDADYVVEKCLYYRRWKQMLRRCYSSHYQVENPSYIGCRVCTSWQRFSNFRAWMMKQDWEGKELDKDILVPNNKVYSPDTCVFIDKKVNQLFSKKNKHGVFGLSYDKKKNIYILTSSTVNQQKAKYSGSYRTLEDAKKASHQMREEYILQVASEQKDERVKKAVLGLIDLHHHTS